MSVVVRFPPSPTGMLHIGSARTALFNWLFAKHHGGKFLLRIEDTDRARSTPESVQAIIEGLEWLGLDWDNRDSPLNYGKPYYSQFEHRERHAEVARELLAKGAAYYCYATPEELELMRQAQKAAVQQQRYDGRWRDRPPSEAPEGIKPAIRLKAPQEGETTIHDRVMGTITVPNSQLDDMVLLRSDGTPTYMLAVVVDDHDMGVTHVIRGDDGLTNAFRQIQIYRAMGWPEPVYAHLPMILGPDGAKLSKRHGAPAVSDYRDRGYLPEAMRNYLLRLCWSHGDDEIISDEQAIEWFDLDGVGKSPARFDFAKLNSINAHYIGKADNERLADLTAPFLAAELGRDLTLDEKSILIKALPDIKPRVQTLREIAEASLFYFKRLKPHEKAQAVLTDEAKNQLREIFALIEGLADFSHESLEALFRNYAKEKGIKLGSIAQPFRAALTGAVVSPPIFGAAELLGKKETLARLKAVL